MSRAAESAGYDERVDPDWELHQLEAAMQGMPAFEDARIGARWAGLYEVTPDAQPIFGSTAI